MKPFEISSVVTAIVVTLSLGTTGGAALAQGTRNPTGLNAAPAQTGNTKLQQQQRDSGAAGDTQNSSGVQARRKPNAGATAPNTSYDTITNAPPSNRTNDTTTDRRPGAAPSAAPAGASVESPQGVSVKDPAGKTNVPESMRIQQNTVRALPTRRDLITKGGSSAPPSVVNSSVERNRLDSAAPSRQRLQIDNLSAQRPQQPNAPLASSPSNPTAGGAASGNGSSGGMSGSSTAPSIGASPAGANSGGAASHSSAGSSSSGGGH